MKKTILTLIAVLLINLSYGQNETNIWYFGDHAGLDFNSGSPVALTDGMTDSWEGMATVSDANGSLLFYTDGITVWDKNHNLMPNGISLAGGFSSTQSALILPDPGNTLFYIFTVQDENTVSDNLSYSIVDITLNGGNGDVTVKNSLLMSQATEKLNAAKNSTNTGVWVMTHGNGNNSFMAFLVNASGVNTVPVISTIGQSFSLNGDNVGYMKFSPDGTKLAVAAWSSNFVELFDFNSANGQVTNNILINIPFAPNGVYGLEFSPSGDYLYAANVNPGNIYQWDITSNVPSTINASMQQVGNNTTSSRGALQLGPDGKIYVAENNATSLGVINNPELPGMLCNFVDNSVSLAGKHCGIGLPNFIQSYFFPTGINQIYSECSVRVYPNPFRNKINISIQKSNLSQVIFEIQNVFGKNIYTSQENNLNITCEKVINLGFLSKGIYFLSVNIDGERIVRKIVKE